MAQRNPFRTGGSAFNLEGLEDRRLLSAASMTTAEFHRHSLSMEGVHLGRSNSQDVSIGNDFGHGHGGHHGFFHATITFDQAPALVQTGLTSLANTDGVTPPTGTDTLRLGNKDGVETYAFDSGETNSPLVVDKAGVAVTEPTQTDTTFDSVGIAAVTDEFNAIAAARNLTAPAAGDNVSVVTDSSGHSVYSIHLSAGSSGSGHHHHHGLDVSVDQNGNPTGNQVVPFSVFFNAIHTGLNDNTPVGATALSATSKIRVTTEDGYTVYSATFRGTGIRTTISVDSTGALHDTPFVDHITFADITSSAATSELQTLANADGFTGTIDGSTDVRAYNEGNGTIVYALKVDVTDSNSDTHSLRLAVDQDGNPTVPADREASFFSGKGHRFIGPPIPVGHGLGGLDDNGGGFGGFFGGHHGFF